MAAAVLNPVAETMASTHRSRPSQEASTSSNKPESSTRTFHRFRASLEQSLRRVQTSKKDKEDYFDSPGSKDKGKEKEKEREKEKDKQSNDERPRGLRRLESKVTFRLTGSKESTPVQPSKTVGESGFVAPSLRGASMSSPALHLVDRSRSVTPSSNDPLKRDRYRKSSIQPTQQQQQQQQGSSRITGPNVLHKRSQRASVQAISSSSNISSSSHFSRQTSSSRHRSTQSQPVNLTSPSSPTLPYSRQLAPTPETPSPLASTPEPPTPPETPTPTGSRLHLARGGTRRASQSSGHLPLGTPPASPTTPRGLSPSPIRPRSPSSSSRTRVVTPVSHRYQGSTSSSHLPISPPSSPSPANRRGSMDGKRPSLEARRPSIDHRRPSIDNPRRTSLDAPRRPSLDAPSRPSFESPSRPSFESPRRSSGEMSRRPRNESPSPVPARRPTINAGGPRSYSQQGTRQFSASTSSLVSPPPNPEHRELVRTATTMLLKEVAKPPVVRTDAALKDWEEVEVRTRALARLERIWGKSGPSGSSTNLTNVGGLSSSGLSASGEERERKLFCDSLRDGFVLCQLMNRLRSSSVVKPDPREDGFARTSNVTKFLAACASYGMPSEERFLRDDLLEGTGESLARVAKTIIGLIKFAQEPPATRSKVLSGQSKRLPSLNGPYLNPTSSSRAAASVPNLNIAPRSTSPGAQGPTSPTRKRYTPPEALSPVRSQSPHDPTSDSPNDKKHNKSGSRPVLSPEGDNEIEGRTTPTRNEDDDDRDRAAMTPPPRSPLRRKRLEDDGNGLFNWARSAMSPSRSSASATSAASSRATVGDSTSSITPGSSVPDHTIRQSVASNSTAMTDTTVTTAVSSLLEVGRNLSNGFKFGTIRTMTTDATSDPPSFSRAEGNSIADELKQKRGGEPPKSPRRERRLTSDNPVIDLTLVAEEGGEFANGSAAAWRDKTNETEQQQQERERENRVRLGKGKWPDDFIDAFQNRTPSSPKAVPPSPTAQLSPEQNDEAVFTSSPTSVSPPRKLAIVGGNRRNDSVESLQQFPRRPSHRARHSIDAPLASPLLPKESVLRRDASPDGSSGKVMLRRQSTTKPGQRSGSYVPRGSADERRSSNGSDDNLVPFPRTSSGSSPSKPSPLDERPPRAMRGRFTSDLEGSTLRRPRPSSYDELGARPAARSRFESMVNLGVASSSNASASDLLTRESLDGSQLRKTLIIKEESKPATHFQLGNCIGRGQFGSVYRALNLNTGQMVAVKRLRLEGLKEEEVTQLMREVDLVKRLSHPSIVKYEGMARDEDTLSIVLEYAENGSLGQTLKAFGKLNERLVASYVVKILEGLHYLHQSDVVHCDLKAANILTTKTGNVKLSDFGVSLNLRAMEREIKDVAGTPNWMAPEVIELKGASTKSDIWSLGCTVVELLTGKPPYGDIANSMTVMFRIVEDARPPLPESCTPLLEDFLKQCFDKDPSKRPSADVLCEHDWLTTNWAGRKELRPQDSIPFLRRVSTDYQKAENIRFAPPELPPSPATDHSPRFDDFISSSPPRNRRLSSSSQRPPIGDTDVSPRDHSFVKTTFSKPMICRVCLLNVKKSAVLCSECSLIAHAKCAVNAPPTCDLRSQLLLYAQYAEKGNPSSPYFNPVDQLGPDANLPTSPMSDVSYVAHSPRTSLDSAPPPQTPALQQNPNPASPPTAFKFMSALKRGRPSTESIPQATASGPKDPPKTNKLEKGAKKSRETARSLKSNSTHNDSSVRSAATAAESVSSSHVLRSVESDALSSTPDERLGPRSSASHGDGNIMQSIPGGLMGGSGDMATRRHKRHHESKSSGNCAVQ